MSSELHYLDIILKTELFTIMSSEFGENCLYFCDFARIFVSLPIFLSDPGVPGPIYGSSCL